MTSTNTVWKTKFLYTTKRLYPLQSTKEQPQTHAHRFPKPPKISNDPNTPFQISDLQALIDYAQKITDYAPATIRTRRFSRNMVVTANQVLQLPDGTPKQEALETIRMQMDFLISKFEALEGPNGLVANLDLAVQGAIDTRLLIDYGDYLAAASTMLKSQSAWRPLKTELFENFEHEMDLDQEQLNNPYISNGEHRPLRYLSACESAATALGWPLDIVKFTIQTYALRNRVCHSGLKVAVEKYDYASAAKRIVMDRRFLQENCTDSDYRAKMLHCIDVAAREYFQGEALIGDVPHYKLQPQHQARLDIAYNSAFNSAVSAP